MMLSLSRLPTLARYVRQEGWGTTLRQLAGALIGMIYRAESGYLVACSLEELPTAPPPRVEVAIHPLRESRIDDLATIVYYGRDEILRRLREGHTCIVAEMDGRIVCYLWLSAGRAYTDEVEKELIFRPDERYMYNGRTLGEVRGKGIFPLVLARAMAELKAGGGRWLLGLVAAKNAPSVRALEKMHFRVRQEIVLRRILWFRRHRTIEYPSNE